MISIPKYVYVDESFVLEHDLLVAALVFSPTDISTDVDSILIKYGFQPKIDEYKSTNNFKTEPRWQLVRDDLLNLLRDRECRFAVTVGSYRHDLRCLGNYVLSTLTQVAEHAGFSVSELVVYLDRDLYRDGGRLNEQLLKYTLADRPKLNFGIDSKQLGGIQTADMIAGFIRTVLVQELRGNPGFVVFGIDEGYEPGTEIMLSEEILMHLAWNFFADPLPPDEYGNQLTWTALPACAYLTDNLESSVKEAAKARLGSLWRGCAH